MNPGQWTTRGNGSPAQAFPRVDVMISCPGTTLPRVNFIAPGASLTLSYHYEFIWIPLVFTQIVTKNEF